MKRLILFRHAKAEARSVDGDDAARALDAQGRADAAAAGGWMAQSGFCPDLVLVSPSVRTLETWGGVEALLPKARLLVEPALYDAMPEDILALIDGHATAETLMVIGHNPGLQEAAVTLLSEAPASVRDADLIAAGFPTATVAILDMSGPAGPSLVALFNPRRAPPPFVEAWDDSEGEGH